MCRLFVCIWIPKELTKEIVELQKKLRGIAIKAKYVEEENFHVTITFLGNVEKNRINEIKNKLKFSLKNVNKFHVNLKGLKIIPNENHIKIIGIDAKSVEFEELIKNIGMELGGSFHEKSKVTLCRVKNIYDRKKIEKFIEDNRNVNIGSFHVKNISLVKSLLTKQGPKYENIYKIELN